MGLGIEQGADASRWREEEEDEWKLIAAVMELSLKSYPGGENGSRVSPTEMGQVAVNREVVLAWQREEEQMDHESKQLARQLHEMEYS